MRWCDEPTNPPKKGGTSQSHWLIRLGIRSQFLMGMIRCWWRNFVHDWGCPISIRAPKTSIDRWSTIPYGNHLFYDYFMGRSRAFPFFQPFQLSILVVPPRLWKPRNVDMFVHIFEPKKIRSVAGRKIPQLVHGGFLPKSCWDFGENLMRTCMYVM